MYCFGIRRRASSLPISKRRRAKLGVEMKFGHDEMHLFSDMCTKEIQVNEQVEQQRARNSFKVLQESILDPEDDEEDFSVFQQRRPASPEDYTLAIDCTALKMVASVINKCKMFQCLSSLYKEECQELLATLVGLHQTLRTIAGCCPCLARYLEVLEDVMLYSTKAFAFMEKICYKLLPTSSHGAHKAAMKMNEFACRFYNQTVRLCEEYEASEDDLRCYSPREQRLSFGVTTYVVPLHNVAERLLKKNRVLIPVRDFDCKSGYNVELSYPRTWFPKDVAVSAKVESNDRGFSQTLHADRVKVEKGTWGWEEAQDTVEIKYDDLVVANVASVTGGLLTYNKHSSLTSPKAFHSQRYKTSIQIVGSSRIDLDLQNLFIKGVKEKDGVYYKCYVNSSGREEVLGIYRFDVENGQHSHEEEGLLHIVGRGNQPGLRHVLVSIFASLGFTAAV